MEITEVKVFPIDEEKLKAFVSVVFDRCFMVNDIKIIQGRQGLFLSMPSRKKKNGEFKDVAHPLNNDTRRMIEGRILAEYERVLEERGEQLEARLRPVGKEAESRPPVGETRTGESRSREAEASPAGEQQQESQSERDASQEDGSEDKDKTLEEVEQQHLRDSFWTVP